MPIIKISNQTLKVEIFDDHGNLVASAPTQLPLADDAVFTVTGGENVGFVLLRWLLGAVGKRFRLRNGEAEIRVKYPTGRQTGTAREGAPV